MIFKRRRATGPFRYLEVPREGYALSFPTTFVPFTFFLLFPIFSRFVSIKIIMDKIVTFMINEEHNVLICRMCDNVVRPDYNGTGHKGSLPHSSSQSCLIRTAIAKWHIVQVVTSSAIYLTSDQI